MTAAELAAAIGEGARGAALAAELWREGAARTARDLRRPEVLRRLPAAARTRIQWRPVSRIPLEEARAVGAELVRRLAPREVVPVGSVRRGAARSSDLDYLVVSADPAALRGLVLRPAAPGDTLSFAADYAAGPRRRSLILRRQPPGGGRPRHYRADFFLATPAEKPFALYHYTGPAAYNIRTRAYANRRGWRLNQYGLFRLADGRRVPGSGALRDEQELARFLGVTWRTPNER